MVSSPQSKKDQQGTDQKLKVRRHLGFWDPFTAWWSKEHAKNGRRAMTAEIRQWYEENAQLAWSEEQLPSYKDLTNHSEGIRPEEHVNTYFKNYRMPLKTGKAQPQKGQNVARAAVVIDRVSNDDDGKDAPMADLCPAVKMRREANSGSLTAVAPTQHAAGNVNGSPIRTAAPQSPVSPGLASPAQQPAHQPLANADACTGLPQTSPISIGGILRGPAAITSAGNISLVMSPTASPQQPYMYGHCYSPMSPYGSNPADGPQRGCLCVNCIGGAGDRLRSYAVPCPVVSGPYMMTSSPVTSPHTPSRSHEPFGLQQQQQWEQRHYHPYHPYQKLPYQPMSPPPRRMQPVSYWHPTAGWCAPPPYYAGYYPHPAYAAYGAPYSIEGYAPPPQQPMYGMHSPAAAGSVQMDMSYPESTYGSMPTSPTPPTVGPATPSPPPAAAEVAAAEAAQLEQQAREEEPEDMDFLRWVVFSEEEEEEEQQQGLGEGADFDAATTPDWELLRWVVQDELE